MTRQTLGRRLIALVGITAIIGTSSTIAAAHEARARRQPETVKQPYPIRITMEELHAQGGVPRRWKFLIPPGDPAAGRRVFVAMECFACHAVEGEHFPEQTRIPRGAGPDLTGMGAHHPAEYFAESIMHPNRVIVLGPGYTGADSFSRMPSYADAMTVKQLIDVVAYVKSLTADDRTSGHEHTTEHAEPP